MNEQGPVTFGNEPFFRALAVALPDLASDLGDDLLTLTVLGPLHLRIQCSIQPVKSLREAFERE